MKALLVAGIAALLAVSGVQAQGFELSDPAPNQTITIGQPLHPAVHAWLEAGGVEITNAILGVECGKGRISTSGSLTPERLSFLCQFVGAQ